MLMVEEAMYVGSGSMWEISVFSTQYFYETEHFTWSTQKCTFYS